MKPTASSPFGVLAWAVVLLFAVVLSGCAATPAQGEPITMPTTVPSPPTSVATAVAAPSTAVVQATPTERLPTATAEPASQGAPVYTPDPVWLAAQSCDGWQRYVQPTYGFAVCYPSNWAIQWPETVGDTMVGHRLDFVDTADPRDMLLLAFRGAQESVQILPTGMSQGEIVERGGIDFLGEPLSRQSLVDRGEDSKILYGGGGEVVRGDLVFWMNVMRIVEGDADRGLREDIQRTADAILSSLVLTEP